MHLNTNKLLLFSFYIFLPLCFFSQKEANIWYFASSAGLDFNTNPPTILTNGAVTSGEGCASMADKNGNFLFASDGSTIWDKTQIVMTNGNGLFGGNGSTSQAAIIIQQPSNDSIYYVFTQDAQNSNNKGLYYSIVNINLAAGNGSVIAKNVLLYNNTTEKLAATKHLNGKDIWIVTHDFNSDVFRSYLLTAAGVNTIAMLSSSGILHNNIGAVGYMKISPDGKKIGLAVSSYTNAGSFEILDFDKATGLVSNAINLGNNYIQPYGCEFSPDCKKFYGTNIYDATIWQWDLCSSFSTTINSSKTIIYSSTLSGFNGAMQIAVDGKIYIASGSQFLGVISNPNNKGLSCNYNPQGQSIAPKSSGYGLPNFINDVFWPGPAINLSGISNSSMCIGEAKVLIASGAQSYTWNSSVVSASISIQPSITTTYSIAATTSIGCIYSELRTIIVDKCLGIDENQLVEEVCFYPNPVVDILNIKLKSEQFTEYKIYNTLGELIQNGSIMSELNWINVEDLPEGICLIFLQSKTGTYFSKFYKSKK